MCAEDLVPGRVLPPMTFEAVAFKQPRAVEEDRARAPPLPPPTR